MKNSAKYLQFWKKYGPCALIAGDLSAAPAGCAAPAEAFADAIARRGLNLILITHEKERLEAAAKRLREHFSVDVMTFAAELADYDKIKSLIEELSKEKQKYSIGFFVYSAAFAPAGLFENSSGEQLSQAAAVSVRTPLLLTKLLSAPMIQNKRGGIVLVSSLADTQGTAKPAVYAATQAFSGVLAEGLWKELRPHGVDVIGCCAGNFAARKLSADAAAEKTLKFIGKKPAV